MCVTECGHISWQSALRSGPIDPSTHTLAQHPAAKCGNSRCHHRQMWLSQCHRRERWRSSTLTDMLSAARYANLSCASWNDPCLDSRLIQPRTRRPCRRPWQVRERQTSALAHQTRWRECQNLPKRRRSTRRRVPQMLALVSAPAHQTSVLGWARQTWAPPRERRRSTRRRVLQMLALVSAPTLQKSARLEHRRQILQTGRVGAAE